MNKLIKVEDEYYMLNKEETETTSLKDAVNFLSFALYEDVCEYRKGKEELKEQIELESMVLNSLTESLKTIS